MIVTLLIAALVCLAIVMFRQIGMNRRYRNQAQAMQFQAEEIFKQMEELKKQNLLSEQLYKEKQQIIGVVSHDLKGPFNRIFALIQLMGFTAENLTEEQREYLGKIHQIIADGLSMVRNLLDNRRLDDDRFEVVVESLNATPLLASLIKNYNILAEKKRIQIHFDTTGAVIISTDRACFNRIMDNLLSNAIKFSPPDRNVYVTTSQSNGHASVSIRDEGPGFTEEDRSKLFQKYQKLSARPTGGESSTGLGLYLAHSLLKKMGGDISYQSGEKGATFVLTFISPNTP